jgi:CubicO group peptidase (beta-lactamase class C family)
MTMHIATMILIAASVIGISSQFTAQGDAANSCGTPLENGGEWPTSSPDDAGLNATLLCSLDEMLDKSPEMNVHSVVVVRGGKLVYESYRTGNDYKWGRWLGPTSYTPQMQHDVRSISKSVVSLLVGIALDRKLIPSIDEPVFTYFTEYAALRTPEKDYIQLRHLLTMTSGLAWDEKRPYSDPENSEIRMIYSSDPYRFVLEQLTTRKPGEEWNYSGGSTQLLAGVVQKVAAKPLSDFANEALFEPLGITQFEWVKMLANEETAAASGLRLRPRDMAKIAELVLNKGMWRGNRIVSESWIQESTQSRVEVVDSVRYGYHWWSDEQKLDNKQISWISAMGLGGQRIYIVPTYDLVVVITGALRQYQPRLGFVRYFRQIRACCY